MLKTLRHRPFAALWSGQAVSAFGDCLYSVAVASLMVGQGAGAGELGIVLSARAVGTAVLAMVGGVLADRIPPARVMLLADLGRAATLLAMALVPDRIPLAVLALLTFLVGAGESLFHPAYTAVMPQVVPEGELQAANALTSVAQKTAQVAGPVAAGFLVAGWDPQVALGVDSATFVVSIMTLLVLVRRLPAARTEKAAGFSRSEFFAGISEIRSRPWLAASVGSSSAYLLFGFSPLILILPLVATHHYGGTGALSALMTGLGGGSLIGAVISTRYRPARRGLAAQTGLAMTAPAMVLIGLHTPLPVAVAATALSGIGYSIFGVIWTTALQQQVPRELLGRVAAVDAAAGLSLMPLGFLVGGGAVDWFGDSRALLIFAPLTIALALLPLFVPGTTHYSGIVERSTTARPATLQADA